MNDELYQKLTASRNYRWVCPSTVRRVLEECEGRYKKPRDLEKAVRERLHGVTSAFMTDAEFKSALALARAGDWESLLSLHASTRERLPLARMDAAYAEIFAHTGAPGSVLDLACGLNPAYLAARHPAARIAGADVSGQCVEVLHALGIAGVALADLLDADAVPDERFQMALMLKLLPLLERQRAGAADELLRRVQAEFLVISFPTRTLGGRDVGMERHYSEWMEAHLPAGRAVAARIVGENELFYILKEN